jgi:hypothetical protein
MLLQISVTKIETLINKQPKWRFWDILQRTQWLTCAAAVLLVVRLRWALTAAWDGDEWGSGGRGQAFAGVRPQPEAAAHDLSANSKWQSKIQTASIEPFRSQASARILKKLLGYGVPHPELKEEDEGESTAARGPLRPLWRGCHSQEAAMVEPHSLGRGVARAKMHGEDGATSPRVVPGAGTALREKRERRRRDAAGGAAGKKV